MNTRFIAGILIGGAAVGATLVGVGLVGEVSAADSFEYQGVVDLTKSDSAKLIGEIQAAGCSTIGGRFVTENFDNQQGKYVGVRLHVQCVTNEASKAPDGAKLVKGK